MRSIGVSFKSYCCFQTALIILSLLSFLHDITYHWIIDQLYIHRINIFYLNLIDDIKPPFLTFKNFLNLRFVVFKFDFKETKLWFSNCKFPSILGLTFQLLNPSRKPSKYNFLSKKWNFWKLSKITKIWL